MQGTGLTFSSSSNLTDVLGALKTHTELARGWGGVRGGGGNLRMRCRYYTFSSWVEDDSAELVCVDEDRVHSWV